MRKVALLFAAMAMALLAGCTTVEQAVPAAPKTPAETVFEVKAAFVSAEDAGLAWAATACPTPSTCQDSRVKAVMEAIVTADVAISGAEETVQANAASSTGAQGAVTDAQAALAAFQAVLAQYGVKTAATITTGN